MALIFVVDDEPDNFDVIDAFLGQQGHDLSYASNGEEALRYLSLKGHPTPDVILLDVMMPVMDGIELCRRLKGNPQWQTIPIIVITAFSRRETMVQCIEAGADDFLSKPVNRLELNARVRSMLRISAQYKKLKVLNATLEQRVQERTQDLESLILRDRLTGLPTRESFLRHLHQRYHQGEYRFAVLYLDCDDFKLVNGSFGHQFSDRLLQAIAQRLQVFCGENDLLARMSEDEFCCYFHGIDRPEKLKSILWKILESFKQSFTVDDVEIFITVSAGVAFSDRPNLGPETLLQNADIAMYHAKTKGKSSYQVFDEKLQSEILERLTLEVDLQKAFKNEEFLLAYQPIMDLKTLTLEGFEVLVRWQHPTDGLISPAKFIPCLETTGLIVSVGMYIFEKACQQLKRWHDMGFSHLSLSINLSVRQFSSPSLVQSIRKILADTQIDPRKLKLEITESALMERPQRAIATLHVLRDLQLQISIDDFGTGYSSLGYLHRFPVSYLKIDQSFVRGLRLNNRNYHVIETITSLSQRLEVAIIAEGIEEETELKLLQHIGCEFGQGYFFSRPIFAEDVETRYLNA